jgi:hypothetical protein
MPTEAALFPRSLARSSLALILFFGWLILFSSHTRAIEYFDPREFQDPVMDAQQDIKRGKYRIWGVLKNKSMRHPGLQPSELAWLKQHNVEVEPKNRWAQYDDTPLPFDQALTMERYVTRYNRSMLQWLRANASSLN